MEFVVFKLKGKDLFFNFCSEIGNLTDKVPLLLSNEEADELLEVNLTVYGDNDGEEYTLQNDFEKRKVKLNLVD